MAAKTPVPVREGTLAGGIAYLAYGDGPPLVMVRTVLPSSANPTGLARWAELRSITPLARHFTVIAIGRQPGLPPTTTMAGLARQLATAIASEWGTGPVDMFGMSTGGSLALQFAADYPTRLRRLVVAATAYTLGSGGRELQQQYADLLARGRYRDALAASAPGFVESRFGQRIAATMLWLLAPVQKIDDAPGMVAMLRAEDSFDLGDRLKQISAPALVIGGDRDRLYPAELVRETAARMPDARLLIYPNHGHREVLAERRLNQDILDFLAE